MFNIFENPYLIIAISAGLFLLHRIIRAINSDIMSNKWLLVPIFTVIFGFAMDFFIKTDNEKLNEIIKTVQKIVCLDDIKPIEYLLCDDYKDSYHQNSKQAVSHLNSILSYSPIEKVQILEKHLALMQATAKIKVKALLFFKPQAPLSMTSVLFNVELKKQPNGEWLICSSELLEVGKQSISYDKI